MRITSVPRAFTAHAFVHTKQIQGIEAVLDLLDGNSEVWEWGEGSSAVYFSQCVKEWNIIVSDPEHCRDIQDLSTPNMKVSPAPAPCSPLFPSF